MDHYHTCASTAPQAQGATKGAAQTSQGCCSGTGGQHESTPGAQRCVFGYVAATPGTHARQPPHHQRHKPQHLGSGEGQPGVEAQPGVIAQCAQCGHNAVHHLQDAAAKSTRTTAIVVPWNPIRIARCSRGGRTMDQ